MAPYSPMSPCPKHLSSLEARPCAVLFSFLTFPRFLALLSSVQFNLASPSWNNSIWRSRPQMTVSLFEQISGHPKPKSSHGLWLGVLGWLASLCVFLFVLFKIHDLCLHCHYIHICISLCVYIHNYSIHIYSKYNLFRLDNATCVYMFLGPPFDDHWITNWCIHSRGRAFLPLSLLSIWVELSLPELSPICITISIRGSLFSSCLSTHVDLVGGASVLSKRRNLTANPVLLALALFLPPFLGASWALGTGVVL